jgi:hypothetical protein
MSFGTRTQKKDLQNPVGIKLHVPSFAAMSIINSVPQDHFFYENKGVLVKSTILMKTLQRKLNA